MIREHRLGTKVMVNYERSNDTWTFSLSNKKWDLVQTGKKYHVEMKMSSGKKWYGDFIGTLYEGTPLLTLPNAKVDFVKQIMQDDSMTLSTEKNGDLSTVYLDGSWDGMMKVVACQKQYGTAPRM